MPLEMASVQGVWIQQAFSSAKTRRFRLYTPTLVARPVSLREKAAKGIAIVAALKMLSMLLSQGSAIVLAIMLVPRDFGIVGIAMVFIGLLERFGNFGIGIGDEILQREERVEEALDTGATLRLLIAASLTLLSIVLAPWAAILYEEPAVADVIRLLSLLFILSFAGFVSRVRLTRDLRFREAVLPDTLGKVSTSVAAIALVLLGFGFWSLVYSLLLGQVIAVAALYIAMPWRIRLRLDVSLVRELLRFGRWVFLSGLVWFVFSTLDNAVVGAFLGLSVLGYYLLAYSWSVTLPTRLNSVVDTVMFPVFSKMKGNMNRLSRAFVETTENVAYIAFPVCLLIVALAPDFVEAVLGSKWIPAITAMQLLAPAGLFLVLAGPAGSLLMALGRPQDLTKYTLIGAVPVIVGLLPALLAYGIEGLAVLVTASALGMSWWVWRRVASLTGLSEATLYRRFARPLMASVVAAVTVVALHLSTQTSLLTLVVEAGLGTVAYLITIAVLTRGAFLGRIREFVRIATA